jgi:hypothetical protein
MLENERRSPVNVALHDDLSDIEQVFLALATAPKKISFDTMDLVLVPDTEVASAGVAHEATEGETVLPELRSRHVDVVALDLDKLASLARIVAYRVRNSHVERRTERQIRRLVVDAVKSGRVQPSELSAELRLKVQAP